MKDHDMKDDYLWDRSGKPDAEIQELEAILGTLRYQPQPLEIPSHIQIGYRRRFFPAMAIAAAIALLAVLVAAWFSFNRRPAPALQVVNNSQIDQPMKTTLPPPNNQALVPAGVKNAIPSSVPKHREALAGNRIRVPRTQTRQPALTPQELAEKEQVLVALRLVSFKLNVAQRKTLGPPPLNTIRNQHKIG
jgi:hypothetical protein